MLNELSRLLTVNGYMPHGYCLSWSPPLIYTFVVSDTLIFLSYLSMPIALAYFAWRRTDFPYRWLLWLFAVFIVACGSTHLFDVIVLWWPVYRLDALLKVATALASVFTAIAIWPMLPRALKLPSPLELQRANEALQVEIAERQRIGEELRLAKEAAEAGLQKVTERTAELAAANQELESFAYAVSHDLRAPLRAMSGFSRALVEDYGERLEGEAKLYLEQIDLASRSMGGLIDGILALSRSTRGELRREAIDVSLLATRLLEELARSEPERRVSWRVEPGLQVSGDPRMIEAVLRNLLGNAWKYTGKTAQPEIRVFADVAGGKPGICVEDNGAGFDMDHAEQLFQPFRRLHRQDEFPGIGIGLATVVRIVRRHGGEIRAEGRPGAGARFCFTLPDSMLADEDAR